MERRKGAGAEGPVAREASLAPSSSRRPGFTAVIGARVIATAYTNDASEEYEVMLEAHRHAN